jgi:hypothetical protein
MAFLCLCSDCRRSGLKRIPAASRKFGIFFQTPPGTPFRMENSFSDLINLASIVLVSWIPLWDAFGGSMVSWNMIHQVRQPIFTNTSREARFAWKHLS